MFGAIVLAIILVVLGPVIIAMSAAVLAGIVGGVLQVDNNNKHADSELLDCNY